MYRPQANLPNSHEQFFDHSRTRMRTRTRTDAYARFQSTKAKAGQSLGDRLRDDGQVCRHHLHDARELHDAPDFPASRRIMNVSDVTLSSVME